MKAIIYTILFLSVIMNMNPLLAQNCPRSKACEGYQNANCDRYMGRKQCRSACITGFVWLDSDVIRIMDNKAYTTRYLRKIVCSATGTVSYQEVEFDHHRAEFVAVDRTRNRQSGQSCSLQCLDGKDDLASVGHRT